jgi:GT2 family glycosyltransferase
MLLSIIIVNVKGKDYLPGLLESLNKSIFKDLEIIVVDNVKNTYSNNIINVIIDDDLGLAYCRNLGAKHANGDYFLFLDNDTKIFEDTLQKFMDYIQKNPDHIVQLKLIKEDNTIDAAGGIIDELGYSYEKSRGDNSDKINQYSRVLYAKGAAMGMSRKVFEALGGFDNDYFYGYDETDICFRAWKMGIEVVFIPISTVVHFEHGSFTKNERKRVEKLTFFLESRRLYFVFKNFSSRFLIERLHLITFYFLGSIFSDIFIRKDLYVAKARIRALGWFIGRLPIIVRERLKEKKMKYNEYELMKLGLIISHKSIRRSMKI